MKDFLKLIFFGVTKSPKLKMVDPDTGEKAEMTIGFNLQILLLGGLFGLPLFFKKLWGWAWGLFLLSAANFFFLYSHFQRILSATTIEEYEAAMQRVSGPAENIIEALLIVIVVLLSVKGNRWAVERLLKKGWRFENTEDALVKDVVRKWNLSKHFLKPVKEKEGF